MVEFICRNGAKVLIEVDDDYTASVQDLDGGKIGRLEFRVIENRDGTDYLKLCWAYLDLGGEDYKRQGIGRECVRLVRELSGMAIVASDHDGHQQDDGSHLTGDAPDFVTRMRTEGLISPSSDAQENG